MRKNTITSLRLTCANTDTHILLPLFSDAPAETREIGIQCEPELQWHGVDIADYDGNCLMKVSNMENFIRTATAHSAHCGKQLVLTERNTTMGSAVQWTYKCPSCETELAFNNCNKVRSSVAAQGASDSRSQPDFNLRIAKAVKLAGVNLQKTTELLEGHLGIKIPTDRSLRKQMTKVHESIRQTFKDRKVENRKEHVDATRRMDRYRGDVTWSSKDGDVHSTSAGDLSMDGAGCTRHYNNHARGRQSAFVVNSKITGKPLSLIISQVNTV